MRIVLYNVTTGIKSGGIETYNWEMARALKENGHDAILVTGDGDRSKFDDIPVVRIPFKGRDEFINLRWVNRKLASALRKYLERRSFAINAEKAVSELKPDCIVIFKPYDFGFMRSLKRNLPGLVVVFRSGGKDFFFWDRFNKRFVDVWISCSSYNKRQIEARYKTEVTVIPHGVQAEVFRPLSRDPAFRGKLGISDNSFVGVCVGRLVKWKGFQTVIKAMVGLTDVELMVIGQGGYQSSLDTLSRDCGVRERVHFLGEIDNYELPYYLQQADVYLHPSHGEEAFGITLLEAMACGLPVIASNRGAIPDVVGEGNGVIVEAGDVDAWREAISELKADNAGRLTLSNAAYERAVNDYAWERSAATLVESIEKAKCMGSSVV